MWITLRYNHFFSRLIYYLSIVGYPSPVISRCLDIRLNTPSRVWYITYRCLHIRWNTPSRVWYITYRCLDIRWNTPSRIWCMTPRCLDTRWNTPSRVDILLIGVLISNETLLLVFDILLLVILLILLCLNIRWNTSTLLVNMLAYSIPSYSWVCQRKTHGLLDQMVDQTEKKKYKLLFIKILYQTCIKT